MVLLGKDILGKKVVHEDNGENEMNKSEVKDILIQKDQPRIAYLTFEMKILTGQGDSDEELRRVAHSISAAGSNMNSGLANTTPGFSAQGSPSSGQAEKRLYLIPSEKITRISESAVIIHGSEIEESKDQQTFSLSFLKDFEVKTKDEETLGKVKDIVIDDSEMNVIGFKLSEGFWGKLAHGAKYMPYRGILEWKDGEMIVESSMKEKLVDDPSEIG